MQINGEKGGLLLIAESWVPAGKCEESVGTGKLFCNYHNKMTESSKNHQQWLNFNRERAGYLNVLGVPSYILLIIYKGRNQWLHTGEIGWHHQQVVSEGQMDAVCLQTWYSAKDTASLFLVFWLRMYKLNLIMRQMIKLKMVNIVFKKGRGWTLFFKNVNIIKRQRQAVGMFQIKD